MATGAPRSVTWLIDPEGPINPGPNGDGINMGDWGFEGWQFVFWVIIKLYEYIAVHNTAARVLDLPDSNILLYAVLNLG